MLLARLGVGGLGVGSVGVGGLGVSGVGVGGRLGGFASVSELVGFFATRLRIVSICFRRCVFRLGHLDRKSVV